MKVNLDKSPSLANAENVRIVPTFKIYKNDTKMNDLNRWQVPNLQVQEGCTLWASCTSVINFVESNISILHLLLQ